MVNKGSSGESSAARKQRVRVHDGRLRVHRFLGGQATRRCGREVWIYDLKEDTHRLDLILEPEQRDRVHFLPGDVVGRRRRPRSAVERVGATHILHLAGLQTPTCRAKPILGAHGQRHRDPGGLRGRTGPQGPGPAGRLRQLGGRSWPGRAVERPPRRRGPPGAAVPLRRLQGLQRAQCPGLLARPRAHQHRPAALDGLRRRPGLRDDQRADQGNQGGGASGGPIASAMEEGRTSSTWATWPRRSCEHSSGLSRVPRPST